MLTCVTPNEWRLHPREQISENHRLAPLDGLTICLTGYDGARQDLRTNISALGGAAYSPMLNSAVTHLVIGPLHAAAADEHGAIKKLGKVDAARQINAKRRAAGSKSQSPLIHIVWGEWLEHSLVVFGRCKEALYDVELVPDRAALLHKRMQRPLDIVERALSPAKEKRSGASGKKRASASGSEGGGSRVLRQETGLGLPTSNQDGEAQSLRTSKRVRTDANVSTRARVSTPAAGIAGNDGHRGEDDDDDGNRTDDGRANAASTKSRPSRSAGAEAAVRKTTRLGAGSGRLSRSVEVSAVQDLLAPAQLPPAIAARGRSAPDFDAKGKGRELIEKGGTHASAASAATVQSANSWVSSAHVPPPAAQAASPAVPIVADGAPPHPAKAESRLAKLGQSRKFTSSSSTPPGPAGAVLSRKASTSSLRVPKVAPIIAEVQDDDAEEEEQEVPVQFLAGKVFHLCFQDAKAEVIANTHAAVRRHGGRISRVDNKQVDYVLCQFAKYVLSRLP